MDNDLIANACYIKTNLRSGQILEKDNSILLFGDVNPGGTVISKGNIIILGSLKGSAYAGSDGDKDCFVIALNMNPLQIRIAGLIARSADQNNQAASAPSGTRIAYIDNDEVVIEQLSKYNHF